MDYISFAHNSLNNSYEMFNLNGDYVGLLTYNIPFKIKYQNNIIEGTIILEDNKAYFIQEAMQLKLLIDETIIGVYERK